MVYVNTEALCWLQIPCYHIGTHRERYGLIRRSRKLQAPRLPSSRKQFGSPHTGKHSRRVRFSQEVQQCLYFPEHIHWQSLLCYQMHNENSVRAREKLNYFYLFFKAQDLGRSVLPLPPAPLKPIDKMSQHSPSVGATFYFEGRK